MVYTLSQIKAISMPIFKSSGVVKAILFGSYAKGVATEDSDIDICIDSQGKLKGLDFIGLSEDIRKELQKEVDLIDITHIDNNSKVEQEIKNTGVIIYEV
ncbi:MAG: hypothetical protein BEN19_01090 [Epulopiscium sp. Nuni2H_MBin003]|nr:MAG: hypothetical protein BEN19_01090 [Epulopiscium sp. Nuni2H_MBin003]